MESVRSCGDGSIRVPDWPEAYNVHPVAVVELRKKLFALTVSDGHEANLARACLTQIDVSRDENGRPETEPRRPDIATGRSWPILPR